MVGCAMSAFPFGQLLSTPLWGYLADYCGDRHVSILVVAGFVTGLCCCLFSVADSVWLLIIVRSSWGMCCGDVGVVQAYLAHVSTSHTLPVAMTLFSVAGLFSMVASPLISGQLSFLGYGYVVSIYGIMNFVVSSLLIITSFMNRMRACVGPERSHTQPVASEESHSFERSLASARFIL